MLDFFLLNSIKFSTPKAEGQSTFSYLFHPHGRDCVLVSFCCKMVYCAFPPRYSTSAFHYPHFYNGQDSKLTLANSQNASDFDNLRVRKISTSKRLRVRIIHVSQTFGESCSNARRNVRTTSEANKTADAELSRARLLLATGHRIAPSSVPHMRVRVLLLFLVVFELSFHYICKKITYFFTRPSGP